jgi:hypothetical protein
MKRPGSQRSTFDLGTVRLSVATDAGPRIVGYQPSGHTDPFADLLDEVIEHPSIGRYWFIGGHRLWRAPEVPAITYHPDEESVEWEQHGDRLTIAGAADPDGIVKVISIEQTGSLTIVNHTLRHEGSSPVRLAPWAITQLRPGGTALLPQERQVDADRVLPNRYLTLWPYTDLDDPGFDSRSHHIAISSDATSAKFKIGQRNRVGWLAYHFGDELFLKWSPLHDDRHSYPHLGGSVECYRDHRFVELETLGPLLDLAPGGETNHREVWTMMSVQTSELDEILTSLPSDPLDHRSG